MEITVNKEGRLVRDDGKTLVLLISTFDETAHEDVWPGWNLVWVAEDEERVIEEETKGQIYWGDTQNIPDMKQLRRRSGHLFRKLRRK